MPREPSKERIAYAARAEFAAHGFAGARVARIADRARANKQLIFYYFGSKRGLYEAVSAEATRAALGAASTEGDLTRPATDRLRAAVTRLFASLADRPELLARLFDEARRPEGPLAADRDAATQLAREIRAVVSDGQGLGYFRDDADPDLTAVLALVLCGGYLGLEPLVDRAAARPDWVREVTGFLTRGLAW